MRRLAPLTTKRGGGAEGYEVNYCDQAGWTFPVSIPVDGDYSESKSSHSKPEGTPVTKPRSAGDRGRIRHRDLAGRKKRFVEKLVELHEKLLGATVIGRFPRCGGRVPTVRGGVGAQTQHEDWREEDIVCEIDDDWYFDGID